MNRQIEFLFNLLMSKDVVENVEKNIDSLLFAVPEIKFMIGFEHKHPNHLDVWQHTLLALSLAPDSFDVRLALLLHDIGKPHSFQNDGQIRHFKGHADKSAELTREILTRLEFEHDYTEYLCKIIKNHDTPLTDEELHNDLAFAKVLFEVQKCDALAHNPEKNKNRQAYICDISKRIDLLGNENVESV